MKRRIVALAVGAGILLLSPVTIFAAKPRVKKASGSAVSRVAGVSYSTARLSRPTNSVVITFINLSQASRVEYMLSYTNNGKQEGAIGTIQLSGQSTDSRDLYFGTCSHGVCTPHRNITGATLTITTTLKSGGTNVKRYRMKI